MPVLTGGGKGTVKRPREDYVVHFPHYDGDPLGPVSALFLGNLKLIHVYETGSDRLFDVVVDPGERHDLAAEMPEKARELDRLLRDRLEKLGARMPVSNKAYDLTRPPAAATKKDRRRGAQRKGAKP